MPRSVTMIMTVQYFFLIVVLIKCPRVAKSHYAIYYPLPEYTRYSNIYELSHYEQRPESNNETCSAILENTFILNSMDLPVYRNKAIANLDDIKVGCGDTNKPCYNYPGLGSGGMHLLGCSTMRCEFVSISNRGPTMDCVAPVNAEGFFVSEFTPFLNKFVLDFASGTIERTSQNYLFYDGTNGALIERKLVLGTPNSNAENKNNLVAHKVTYDTPPTCEATPIPDANTNQFGMNPGGIQNILSPTGEKYFVVVEEYGPSVAFVSADAINVGKVLCKYVPINAPAFENLDVTGYDIKKNLPEIYNSRYQDKGFEGVACNQKCTLDKQCVDGYTCLLFMQAPLRIQPYTSDNVEPSLSTEDAEPQRSYLYRVLEMNYLAGINYATPGKEFIVEAAITPMTSYSVPYTGTPSSIWTDLTNEPKDLSISDAVYIDVNQVAVVERAKGQVMYWHLDFTDATDVSGMPWANVEGKFMDDPTTKQPQKSLFGIVPAKKTLMMNSATTQGWNLSYKQSGFTIVGDSIVSIEDNEFGLNGNSNTRVGVIQMNPACRYHLSPEELFPEHGNLIDSDIIGGRH